MSWLNDILNNLRPKQNQLPALPNATRINDLPASSPTRAYQPNPTPVPTPTPPSSLPVLPNATRISDLPANSPTRSYISQPSGGQTLGTSTDWNSIYNNYYQGWNEQSAKSDFAGAQGGNLQNLLSARGLTADAEAAKQSRLKAIQDRIAMIKDIASRNTSQAGDVRNEVVGNIGSTYENLRNRANQAKESSLSNLGQEDISVQNQYGRAEGTARRAIESALTRNRMLARSLNRLGGSFYTDQQAQTNETGARSITDIGAELAGKRSGIQTRVTDTKNYFEAQTQDLANEEGQLKSQAEQEYQKQANAASDMQRAYGIDSEEQLAQAEQEYQSRLDQINAYIQNKASTLNQVASTATNRPGRCQENEPLSTILVAF